MEKPGGCTIPIDCLDCVEAVWCYSDEDLEKMGYFKKLEVNECSDAYVNPKCPYVTQINKHDKDLAKIGTDVEWLKKGYWIQTGITVGTFIAVLALAIWAVTGIKIPF